MAILDVPQLEATCTVDVVYQALIIGMPRLAARPSPRVVATMCCAAKTRGPAHGRIPHSLICKCTLTCILAIPNGNPQQ